MDDLLEFANTCHRLRAETAPLKCHYPREIKLKAVELSRQYHIEEVAFQIEVASATVCRWEKDLAVSGNGFTKVVVTSSHPRPKEPIASFEVVLNGNRLQFPLAPSPKWFAQLLAEVRPC